MKPQVILLVLAVILWALAAFKCPEPRFFSWGWGGLLAFGLSLLWPYIQ